MKPALLLAFFVLMVLGLGCQVQLNFLNLYGGMLAWKAAGYEVIPE